MGSETPGAWTGAVVGCSAAGPGAAGAAGAVGWVQAAASVAAAVNEDRRMNSRRDRLCMMLLSEIGGAGAHPTRHTYGHRNGGKVWLPPLSMGGIRE